MLRKQNGVAGVEVLLLVTVAALLSFVVVKTYNARHAQVATVPVAKSAPASDYKSTADLTTAQQQLDQTDLDTTVTGADSTELDQDLATF